MTDCSNVEMRERLPDLLHGRLGTGARAEVEAHLATCDACAAELALLQEARYAMAQAPAVNTGRIVAALPRPGTVPLTVSRGGGGGPAAARGALPAWRRYGIAASLLLAAGVAGYPLLRGAGADAPAVPSGVAAAEQGTTGAPAARASAGADDRLLAVNVEGLSDDDFAGLLDGLDDLEAMPASDPLPLVPVERSAGGSD